MAENVKLPELPEPSNILCDGCKWDSVKGYTADQMREYGSACMNAALQPSSEGAVDCASYWGGDCEHASTVAALRREVERLKGWLADANTRATRNGAAISRVEALADELELASATNASAYGWDPVSAHFRSTSRALRKIIGELE